jgi:hypothetical protein
LFARPMRCTAQPSWISRRVTASFRCCARRAWPGCSSRTGARRLLRCGLSALRRRKIP